MRCKQWFENRPIDVNPKINPNFINDIFELQKHNPSGKVFVFERTKDNFLNFPDTDERAISFKHFVAIGLNNQIKVLENKRNKGHFTAFHVRENPNWSYSFHFDSKWLQYTVTVLQGKDIVNAKCFKI